MRFPGALFLCGMLAVSALHAENVKISGFVTSAVSRSDFDVNAIRIRCGNETKIATPIGKRKYSEIHGCPQNALYIGEPVAVEGSYGKKHRFLTAQTIVFPGKDLGKVAGSAVIDALPPWQSAASGTLQVRADGYRILITGKTLVVWDKPLHALADVKTGDWINYTGEQQADGTVLAEKVRLARLVVSNGEKKFRKKQNFNPSKVPVSAKQSALSMAFRGINLKRFPPYHDPQMQARVTDIGEKLVPAYQRNLPDSDAMKIHFRFQVISTKVFRDAIALSSGIILVPQQVVARMQNDSQLAAVLADNIATVLERQAYRDLPAGRALGAGQTAAYVAGFFVPGAFLIDPALGIGGGKAMLVKAEDQSGRVALGLMHDAGYDIDQAPMAWWLLASKKPKPISKINMPHLAAYLYGILGKCWNSPGAIAIMR